MRNIGVLAITALLLISISNAESVQNKEQDIVAAIQEIIPQVDMSAIKPLARMFKKEAAAFLKDSDDDNDDDNNNDDDDDDNNNDDLKPSDDDNDERKPEDDMDNKIIKDEDFEVVSQVQNLNGVAKENLLPALNYLLGGLDEEQAAKLDFEENEYTFVVINGTGKHSVKLTKEDGGLYNIEVSTSSA